LTGPASLPQATRDELARLGPTRIVLLGGVGAVSDEVEVALGEYAPDVVRVAGPDRYTTAAAISAAALDAGAGSAFLATGLTFPDALAAVPAAASQAAPILLAAGGLPAAVQAELDRLDPDRVFLLGGGAALPIRVAKEAQRTLGICWAANKPAAGAQQVLTRIAGAEGQVALTFDMGGRLSPAVDIVRYLIDDQICATFFPTGAAAQTTIGRQVLAVVAEHPELFEVGNHTVHHCNLRDGGGGAACPASPDAAFIRSELKAAATVISGLTGQSPAPYWRPPYGASDATVRSVAASVGYTTTVMWHVDTIDWDPDTTADLIVSRVLAKVTDGSIVLLHLGGYHTLDALPTLVDELRGRGYGLTTISDLLDR
jgi:peptidoglycan/xylan/chitin deacetylase (PgdA/CDA1 family)